MSGEQTVCLGEDVVLALKNDFKSIMREVVQESLLDNLQNDMWGLMKELMKESLPDILRDELPNILVDVNERAKQIERARQDAEDFIDENPGKFNEGYRNRNKVFEGYVRCMNLTKLYNEYLQSNPTYIPRKFRDDKYYVRDEEELEIINNRFMGKFQSDFNLLKKGQRDFATAVNTEDDIIYNFIEHCNIPDRVKTEIDAIWERDRKIDEKKIEEEWTKKITGMKQAYEKDKQHLAELNRERAKKFEEIRQSARAVPINEANLEEDSDQESTGEFVNRDELENTLTDVPELPHGEESAANPPPQPVAMEIKETPPESEVREENANATEGVILVDDTMDSSATLFDSTPDITVATPNTNNNIQMMATNFSEISNNSQNRTKSNYKFRKRPLLR